MSQEPLPKNVRKGTRSCVDCRHRKVRCVWPSEGAQTCKSCLARGASCKMQVHMVPTSETITMTSRARIVQLEGEVSSLWTAVRNLEGKLGCTPTQDFADPHPTPWRTEDASRCHEKPNDEDSDSNASELSPTNPPSHLLPLFDNGLLGSDPNGSAAPPCQLPNLHRAQGSAVLRRLMPSREDMIAIASHATSWLDLYYALFPMINLTRTSDEMLSQYDKLQVPDADPVALGALLLSAAITVQQTPNVTIGRVARNIRDADLFIKDVSDTVERIIVSDDALAGSLEGIETSLLFLRLQLRRSKVKKMWLLTRRIIALAELIGLPRASIAVVSHNTYSGASPSSLELWKQKAEIWESICTIDRMLSMMWSLPLATPNHPLPKRDIIDSKGKVNPQSYLYSLAEIMSRIQELDNFYSSGKPLPELLDAVTGADQELRSLARLTPESWWKIHWPQLSIDALLQYWHQYMTVRTHLQLGLKYDGGQEFTFNFIACLNACQDLAKRYIFMRPMLPAGFFANRVIDLQTFTATVFMLLALSRTTRGSGNSLQAVDAGATTDLIDQVVQTMGFAAGRLGGEFANQAANAIRSLNTLLQQPQTSEAHKITLNLAFVGKIHVSRKSTTARNIPNQPYPTPSRQHQGTWQTTTSTGGYTTHSDRTMLAESPDLNMMGSLSYSMEIPDTYPFFADETFGNEQWLTWTGWDGNS